MTVIRDLLRKNEPLLERLFGAGQFEVNELTDSCCEIVTRTAHIHVAYDTGRKTMDSQLRALQVPERLSESMPVEWWLRFLDKDDPLRRSGPLNEQQVTQELHLVGSVVQSALSDLRTARDATCFLRGYGHGRLDAD